MRFNLPHLAAVLWVLASLIVAAPASADSGAVSPAATPADSLDVRVAAIVDGDTLAIEPALGGFDRLRLAGIRAIKPPLDRPPGRPWPLAEQAHDALAALAGGASLRLSPCPQDVDRYGRLIAHAHLGDGRWLQGELLAAGLARVATTPECRDRAAEMLAIEAEARAARRGLWGSPVYAVRTPMEVRDQIGAFAVVEGSVLKVGRVKDRVYLNFGADWRDDFTVTVDTTNLPLFEAAGLDPLALAGRRIRVRGWVERYNGPAIEATHAEQIEVLGLAP